MCSPFLSPPAPFPSEPLPWDLDTPPWSPCHLCCSWAPARAILCPHHSPTARLSLPLTPLRELFSSPGSDRTHPFSSVRNQLAGLTVHPPQTGMGVTPGSLTHCGPEHRRCCPLPHRRSPPSPTQSGTSQVRVGKINIIIYIHHLSPSPTPPKPALAVQYLWMWVGPGRTGPVYAWGASAQLADRPRGRLSCSRALGPARGCGACPFSCLCLTNNAVLEAIQGQALCDQQRGCPEARSLKPAGWMVPHCPLKGRPALAETHPGSCLQFTPSHTQLLTKRETPGAG